MKTGSEEGQVFADAFLKLLSEQMDLYYESTSLADEPASLLQVILSLAELKTLGEQDQQGRELAGGLEARYLEKAGFDKREEALNWLRIGRLSWKLRDNDNILLARLENQLYLYLKKAWVRLLQEGLVDEGGS